MLSLGTRPRGRGQSVARLAYGSGSGFEDCSAPLPIAPAERTALASMVVAEETGSLGSGTVLRQRAAHYLPALVSA